MTFQWSKKRIEKIFILIILIICMIVLIISSFFLIKDFYEHRKSGEANAKLIEDVIKETEYEEKIEIDWDTLENLNSDIIGWIKIEGTNINYPILKDDSNLKYLNHSFDEEINTNGSIFTLNQNPFEDNETIIYGHNMKTGLMFSNLGQYMERKFFYEHLNFEIYTRNQNYKATVFSCYSINVNKEEKNIELLSFEDEIEYYKRSSEYSVENIGEIEKIVKLSTCSYIDNHTVPTSQRYFVIAKIEKVN